MRNHTPLCRHCRHPLREGQARWAGHEPQEAWHYSCATRAGLTQSAARPPSTSSLAAAISALQVWPDGNSRMRRK